MPNLLSRFRDNRLGMMTRNALSRLAVEHAVRTMNMPEDIRRGYEEPLSAPAIGPISLDPTDYIGPNTLAKIAAGVKGLGGGMVGATAWHGSPHLFDKFKSEAIGTGEGAQAYGHGLYLAENPSVAGTYSKPVGNATVLGYDAKKYGGASLDEIRQMLLQNEVNPKQIAEHAQDPQSYLGRIAKGITTGKLKLDAGHLYKTDIPDAHIDKMLDWDKPLSEQPYVLKALQDAGYGRTDTPGITGAYFAPKTKEEAMALHQAGIPGIKYLDASSRTSGDGTRNFVIFNPDDIRILERNGQPTGLKPWDINE